MPIRPFAHTLGALALAASPAAFGAVSSFNTDAEGWSAIGDVEGPLTWSATTGNPGGHVFIDDLTTGGVTYYVAPAAFLGDKSAAYGSALTFDLRQVYPGGANQFDADDVVLQGAGLTLAYDLAANPANGAWTSYAVPLVAGGWHLGTLGGALASEAQVQAVLGSLSALRIRAEFQSGADVGSLDNVSLVPEPQSLLLFAAGGGLLWLRGRRRAHGARAA